ncbi:hypothetical protein LRP49_19580 [Enterovibrio sp. ZSDZ35]|uniref:Lipoprotein n=1 Tax=Enterovibrio qingdaonensis TaxID=2899818 RepID=A0ABT5QSW6_9GAMM|nr:hypothetical protein [Enterovibrio sp. ZSDZ35]MDD1783376.1 hypothetical protein [Enterovibrio sp. ZSDZ35]
MKNTLKKSKYLALPLALILVGCGADYPSKSEARSAVETAAVQAAQAMGGLFEIELDDIDLSDCNVVGNEEDGIVSCHVTAKATTTMSLFGESATEVSDFSEQVEFQKIDSEWVAI